MEALEIRTIFTFSLFGYNIPITETVVVSWIAMAILIAVALIFVRNFKEIPKGFQAFLEAGVEFVNNFSKNNFGPFAKHLGPYMGSLFLFILTTSIIGVVSPVELNFMGHSFVPPFPIRPPTKDINVTAALALISIILVIFCGIAARGFRGWLKRFLYPVAFMLPFNIIEYGTRLMSLTLRLFGNMMGGFVIMSIVEGKIPVVIPAILSLYFDFFDGIIQAGIFVFLTSLYISEAVTLNEE